MRTLRQILKLCKVGARLTSTDAAVVADNVLVSVECTPRHKELAANATTWYCVRNVCWGGRRLKAIHMCYTGYEIGIPLTLGRLEARLATRKSTRKSTNSRDLVLAALRDIIRPQIATYRAQFWAKYDQRVKVALSMQMDPPAYPRCPISGKSLKTNQTHVDHSVVPFVRLAETWAAATGQSWDTLASGTRKSRKLGRYTLGSDLADQSWYSYHLDNAVLQLTEAKANMAKGAR